MKTLIALTAILLPLSTSFAQAISKRAQMIATNGTEVNVALYVNKQTPPNGQEVYRAYPLFLTVKLPANKSNVSRIDMRVINNCTLTGMGRQPFTVQEVYNCKISKDGTATRFGTERCSLISTSPRALELLNFYGASLNEGSLLLGAELRGLSDLKCAQEIAVLLNNTEWLEDSYSGNYGNHNFKPKLLW